MRLLGLILALGIIAWVLYTASGGGRNETIVPEGYQQSMEKAQGVEQTLQDTEDRLKEQLEATGN